MTSSNAYIIAGIVMLTFDHTGSGWLLISFGVLAGAASHGDKK